MPMESARKKLMSSPHPWGGPPPSTQSPPPFLDCDQCRERGTRANNKGPSRPQGRDLFDAHNDDNGIAGGHLTMSRTHNKINPAISTRGWSYNSVLKHGGNFCPIERIKATSSIDVIQNAIKRYEEEGIPMIIEGWHEHEKWPQDMFSLDFFQAHTSDGMINVRNVHDLKDSVLPLADFIEQCRNAPHCVAADEEVRMYGKDAECPAEWKSWLETEGVLPVSLLWNGPQDYFRYRPETTRVETLMCYVGVGDTFTAAHKDLCASSGHNLMCYTENDGASYWFMTKSSDAPDVGDYFHQLGQELDHETHVISLDELKKAPFEVYVGKQVLGDLVLVPPRSCHQVINFGGITLKTSWSRMSLKGLSTALYHELPLYQRACRFETYRVKSTVFYSLLSHLPEVQEIKKRLKLASSSARFASKESERKIRIEHIEKTQCLAVLFKLYTDILAEEYSPDCNNMEQLNEGRNQLDEDHAVTCDFCGCDIFQSFLECSKCVRGGNSSSGDRGTYTICASCYVEGRGCCCLAMEKKQVFSFDFLFKLQRDVAEVLSRSGHQATIFDPQSDHHSIFVAACYLHDERQRGAGNICNIDKARAQGLSCRACHNSKCFTHLLTVYSMHASDALLSSHSDVKTHANYHQLHRTLRDNYPRQVPLVKDCQRLGNAPDASLAPYLRAHVALQHGVCRPVLFSLSSPGFYDDRIQDCGEEQADEGPMHPAIEHDNRYDLEILTDMSALTSLPEDEDMAIVEASTARGMPMPVARSSGRSADRLSVSRSSSVRVNMAYIAVPPLRQAPPPGPVPGGFQSRANRPTTTRGPLSKQRKLLKQPAKAISKAGPSNLGFPNPKPSGRTRATRATIPPIPSRASSSKIGIHDGEETLSDKDEQHSDKKRKRKAENQSKPQPAASEDGNRKRSRTEASLAGNAFPSDLAAALNSASAIEATENEPEQIPSSVAAAGRRRQPARKAASYSSRPIAPASPPVPKKRLVDVSKGSDVESRQDNQHNVQTIAKPPAPVFPRAEQGRSDATQPPPNSAVRRRSGSSTHEKSDIAQTAHVDSVVAGQLDTSVSRGLSSGSALSSTPVVKHRFRSGLLVTLEDSPSTATSISTSKAASKSTISPGAVDQGENAAALDLASALNRANSRNTSTRAEVKKLNNENTVGLGASIPGWSLAFTPAMVEAQSSGPSKSGDFPQTPLLSETQLKANSNGTGSSTPVQLSVHITMQQQSPPQYLPPPAAPLPPVPLQTPSQDQSQSREGFNKQGTQLERPMYTSHPARHYRQPLPPNNTIYPNPHGLTRRVSEPVPERSPSPSSRSIYDRPPSPSAAQIYHHTKHQQEPERRLHTARDTFHVHPVSPHHQWNHPRGRVLVQPQRQQQGFNPPNPGNNARGNNRGYAHSSRGTHSRPHVPRNAGPFGMPPPNRHQPQPHEQMPGQEKIPLISRIGLGLETGPEPRVEPPERGRGSLARLHFWTSHPPEKQKPTIYDRIEATSSRQTPNNAISTSQPDAGGPRRWDSRTPNQPPDPRNVPSGSRQSASAPVTPTTDTGRQPYPVPLFPQRQGLPLQSPPPAPASRPSTAAGHSRQPPDDHQDWETGYVMDEEPASRNPPSRRHSLRPRSAASVNRRPLMRSPPRASSPRRAFDSGFEGEPNPWM